MEIKFKELKKRYKEAKENSITSFFIEDKEILTSYAKYLIEYCEMQGLQDESIINLVEQ